MNAYFANDTATIVYSILENGHRVDAFLAIGETVNTQWGPRKVVDHEKIVVALAPSEPFGV